MDIGNVYTGRILLIDDEKDILDLLNTSLLMDGFKNIYTATTGEEGVDLCMSIQPDIVVLDVMLPGIDGLEVCRRLREFSYIPILFLSARGEEMDRLIGLGIGGDDYITKPFSPKEVVYRIKAQLRRVHYAENANRGQLIQIGGIGIDQDRGSVSKDGKPVELTAKEYQIITYMARRANKILSKKEIFESIWEGEYLYDDNTIMVHIHNLREKLEENPTKPKYIVTVKGLGYKLMAEDI